MVSRRSSVAARLFSFRNAFKEFTPLSVRRIRRLKQL